MIDQALLQNSTKGDESHNAALTWWNSQIRSLGPDAYSITWEVLKKKTTEKYCPQFVANGIEKIDKYVSGLPDNIYGSVKDSKPNTLDETIELANDLMDQKLRTYAERQTNNKKTTMVINNNPSKGKMSPKFTIWGRAKRSRTVEICPTAPSAIFITMARVPRSATSTTRANPKGNGCFKCGAPGHFKRDCPKLKIKDGGNVNAQG
nr:hypothetical protein [Tanacetum cinerariifolium]